MAVKMTNLARFFWPVRIYYEDTDSGGVVYYANYLKYMERARTEWLRQLGFEQDELICDAGIVFAVRSVEVDYLRPARFNDALMVSAEVVNSGGASITFQQEVCRGEEVLCRGKVKIASLDAQSFRPRQVPETIAAALLK
ncbi:MAG: tol-pal system-associated acyl-CoA thioesterase [Thiohalomonadaceae bacterium]